MSSSVDEVTQLKRKRAGKKGSITRRTGVIHRMISEGGSRTKITFLHGAVLEVQKAITELHDKIGALVELTEEDVTWMEDVNETVDYCSAEVKDYLEARKDDPPSEPSITQSWVEQHNALRDDEESGGEDNTREVYKTPRNDDPTLVHSDDGSQNLGFQDIIDQWNRLNNEPVVTSAGVDGDIHTNSRGNLGGLPSQEHLNHAPQFQQYRDTTGCDGDSSTMGQWLRDGQGHPVLNAASQPFVPNTSTKTFNQPVLRSPTLRFPVRSAARHATTTRNPVYTAGHHSAARFRNPVQPQTVFSLPTYYTPPNMQRQNPMKPIVNEVDSWIDQLDETKMQTMPNSVTQGITADVTMSWLVQQSLPRTTIPTFSGAPVSWVPFITKFYTLIHKQAFLSDEQRSMYLLDHLDGEAKRSVSGYSHNTSGYVLSLKRLKFLFGQRSKVAQAYLSKVTRGNQVPDNDVEALVEFYYTVSDCLVALRQLNYASDMFSSDTLRQAVRRLPSHLHMKWAEHSLRIKRNDVEPNLLDLEVWLQTRVMAYKDYCGKPSHPPKKHGDSNGAKSGGKKGSDVIGGNFTKTEKGCQHCKGKHKISRCETFLKLAPESRLDSVKSRKLCFNCLGIGHDYSSCSSKNTCFITGCEKKHHTLLHEYFISSKDGQGGDSSTSPAAAKVVDDEKKGDDKAENDALVGMIGARKKETFLQIVPVTLRSELGQDIDTYALLDDGSQRTLLRDDIAERLHLNGEPEALSVSTVIEKAEQSIPTKSTSLTVYSRDRGFELEIDDVSVVPAKNFNMPRRPRLEDCDHFTHLDNISIDAISPDDITLLIGGDEAEVHIPLDVQRGRKDQPLAVKTPFGWTLFGASRTQSAQSPIASEINISHLQVTRSAPDQHVNTVIQDLWSVVPTRSVHVNFVSASPAADDGLQDLVEKFWVQEHTSILPDRDFAPSVEDEDLLSKLDRETYQDEDGHYVVPMLWDDRVKTLPNNDSLAEKRWIYLRRRLRRDPELFRMYKTVIDSYVENGYARRLTPEEAAERTDKTWIIPHHPVVNINKPGEVRVVNDAAAMFEGVSLNAALKTGPDLLNSLIGIIIRFRTNRYAIAADIKAMFHQVRVPEKDRDSLRFLWTDDIHSDADPYVMQMLVHIFGAKDSPCCANYAVKRTARDYQHLFDPLTFETALRAFYVDDLLKSTHTVATAILLAKELIAMLECGGFYLTKFMSNSREILDALPASRVSPKLKLDFDTEDVQRALGISWDINSDTFTFSPKLIDAPFTKRGIVRVTCSLFDPMGFITPFILGAKILVQELWRCGVDWDDTIGEEPANSWRKWLEAVKNVTSISINRCYISRFSDAVVEVQLHIFCDASEAAYGSVAYFRFSLKSGGHKCEFVLSKSKLAPIKVITLPRLELSAAVTAVRMYKTIIRETDLPVRTVRFWTDSTLTLQYIYTKTLRPKAFVANRKKEINEATDTASWGHVPGDENPADLLTRGVSDPSQLMTPTADGSSWFEGPAFLEKEEDEWPSRVVDQLDARDPEIRKKSVLVALGIVEEKVEGVVLSPERYSSWTKLTRVVGWVRRFLRNRIATLRPELNVKLAVGDLTCDEIEAAENVVVKVVQNDTFSDELQILGSGKSLPTRNKISPLSPFVDSSGFLRVGGRIESAPVPTNEKHQLILPKDHPVTKLLIMHCHRRNAHVGREHVLATLRERYWIVNGRCAVKSVLRKCFLCRFRKARQQYPFMASLPLGRVAYGEPPFTHCGVDLFGPITIKQGRKRLKRWAVLFTCLTVRCVHLEVVDSLDTDAFIDSLRRFTNRRGCPQQIYSDCGTNFKGATSELADAIASLDRKEIQSFATSEKIVWNFNPPAAPHMGGAWERLVRSSKEVLTALMKNHVLTDPQLYTLLTEVEKILNSRPLTHLSDDVSDLSPLTPNHILLGLHRNWDYACEVNDRDVNSRKKYRQVQAIANRFWEQWRREYLPRLTKRTRWRENLKNISVGELVVLVEDDQKRGKWPLARVTKVFTSADGVVRSLEIKTKNGLYTRPAAKICRLEE